VLKLDPFELQHREEERGYQWHEVDSSIASKENKLPGRRFEAGATPQRSQSSYPSIYHPSTRLSTTRWADVQKWERGRLDAIAASGGEKEIERMGRIGARRQRVGNMDLLARFSSLYMLMQHLAGAMCGAWSPPPPPVHAAQTLTGGPGPPVKLCGSNKSNEARRRSIPRASRANRGSRFGSRTTTVTASTSTTPTAGLQHGKASLQHFVCQRAHYDTTCQHGVDTYMLVEPHYRHAGQGHILRRVAREQKYWPHLQVRHLS
jgi:hypothetical protein